MADPRVLQAMAAPLLGQFDPDFTAIMNEVMALTRFVFQTENARAFPVPGTGRAGLEAAIVSLVEPGERVVVGECGRFGLLLIEIAERCGAEVVPVRAEWGRAIEPDAIARRPARGQNASGRDDSRGDVHRRASAARRRSRGWPAPTTPSSWPTPSSRSAAARWRPTPGAWT